MKTQEGDVLSAIASGIKNDLEKRFPNFMFNQTSRRIKSRGYRIELIAQCINKHNEWELSFKVYVENDRIRLYDNGFDGFNHDGLSHTDYEYANPDSLDLLYDDIEFRFT